MLCYGDYIWQQPDSNCHNSVSGAGMCNFISMLQVVGWCTAERVSGNGGIYSADLSALYHR